MFEWKPQYLIGVPEIDSDHQMLFQTGAELEQAMAAGQANDILIKLCIRLLAYTRKHFAEEEAQMRSSGYPELLTHKMAHDEITKRVEEFCRQAQAGRETLAEDLLRFLQLIRDHILGTDRKFGTYLFIHQPRPGRKVSPTAEPNSGEAQLSA